ncbi:MAG: M28 family metallopeptidase [Candidatus Hermodarchaeota archaeon]
MIDETRIKKNLELVSFPRLSGTEHEKKAFEIVKKRIEDLNLKPNVQRFTFTSFYPRIYQKIVFISSFWALFILYLNIGFIFTTLNLLIILIIFLPFFIITRNPEKIRIGKKKNSHNLYVKILGNSKVDNYNENSSEQDNIRGNLLFMCHLDSKGQRLPMNYRVNLFKIWIYSSILCLFLFLLKNMILVQYTIWLFLVGIFPLTLNLIAVIVLCLNTTNNKSPGATDNASGIVCVLELLNYYSNLNNRLKNYNLFFLFTGAEEAGTMGIRHLYHKIKHLDRTKSFMLNFDTIGTKLDVITGERGVAFFKNTKDFTINIHFPKKIILSRSDAYVLADKGFRGFGVLDIESHKYVHSKHDTIDKVDCSLLKKLLIHITLMLKFLDKKRIE